MDDMKPALICVYDEEEGVWRERPEPFAVVEYLTEEDFKFVEAAVEHYKKHRWISVKDRLPEVGEEVLCWCECDGEIHSRGVGWIIYGKSWYARTPSGTNPRVTHWMPLPEPPEGE